MKPITRKEYYLAKAAGTYTGPTPPPVLREDYYIATLAGDYSGNCPAPVTRLEKYMSAAAGLTTYVPQPVTRIEKYWYAIAKGTGYVPEPVTREEKFLYAVLKNPPKPEYLDKAAQGSLILLTDSVQAPLTSLTLYGHSTQDGTPSPENPVTIVSAGSVMTTGAQLLDLGHTPVTSSSDKYEVGYTVTKDGLTATVQADGGIKITGTKTTEDWTNIFWVTFQESNLPSIPAGEYTITANKQNQTISIRIGGRNYSNTFTLNDDLQINGYYIAYNGIQTVNDVVYPMLNAGSTALPWEPYTGGVPGVNPYEGEINVSVSDGGTQSQTLTLSTPGGLPGIPVSSGGNYTDENGQQWVCDEIDLKRGKYVQRVSKVVVDGVNVKFKDKNDSFWNLPDFTAPGIAQAAGVPYSSNYFPEYIFEGNLKYDFIFTTEENINPYFSSDDELNAFCAEKYTDGQPLEIYYPIDPIETDLPAEEIAAYKALHTYSPTTTVTNDADAWMKVGYKANT